MYDYADAICIAASYLINSTAEISMMKYDQISEDFEEITCTKNLN